MWFVYIVRCADKTLYTGITTDIARRLREHNGDVNRGAHYTLAKRPVALVYAETADTQSKALRREAVIKKLSKQQKENLTRTPCYVTIEPC